MNKVTFNDLTIESLEAETVLDTLLRHKMDVAYSCKTGLCQTCMLRASKGVIPKEAQKDLTDTLKQQNYFLPCCCIPVEDMEIKQVNENEIYGHAIVRNKEMLGTDICRLQIEPSTQLYYHSGQFINLRRSDNLIRSYSLASLPQTEPLLELHIKRMQNGRMSNWLLDEIQIGDNIDIQGPFGDCFYSTSATNTYDLILIGTGTGLAPLYGIIKDALYSQHKGNIYLYHGSRNINGLYLKKELQELEKHYKNFYYHPCLSGEKARNNIHYGRAHDIALKNHTLNESKIYLCGAPAMVKTTKKRVYLAGAKITNIYADPFELTDLRSESRT